MAHYTNEQAEAAKKAGNGATDLIIKIAQEVDSGKWPEEMVERMKSLNSRLILLDITTNGIVVGNLIQDGIRADLQTALYKFSEDASAGEFPQTVTDGIPPFGDVYQALINTLPQSNIDG